MGEGDLRREDEGSSDRSCLGVKLGCRGAWDITSFCERDAASS